HQHPSSLDSSGRVTVGATRSLPTSAGATSPDGTAEAKRSPPVGLARHANSEGATGQPPSASKPRLPAPRTERRHARRFSSQRVARDGLTSPAQNPTRRHHQARHSRPQSEWSLARCPAARTTLQRVLSSKSQNHPTSNHQPHPGSKGVYQQA